VRCCVRGPVFRLASRLEAEHRARLARFLDGLKESGLEPEAVKIYGAARLAGREQVYETYYRGLSNDAAHPSVTSLNRHLKANDRGEVTGLHWGPDAMDVEDIMINACTAAIYLVAYAQEIVTNHGVFDGLDSCWEQYTKLVDAKKHAPA
jgi:hypothetical protein